MKVKEIRSFAERKPFRPFSVRLSNGAQYTFKAPTNLGAPKDYHVLFFFGDKDWALIDTGSIVEIMTPDADD